MNYTTLLKEHNTNTITIEREMTRKEWLINRNSIIKLAKFIIFEQRKIYEKEKSKCEINIINGEKTVLFKNILSETSIGDNKITIHNETKDTSGFSFTRDYTNIYDAAKSFYTYDNLQITFIAKSHRDEDKKLIKTYIQEITIPKNYTNVKTLESIFDV